MAGPNLLIGNGEVLAGPIDKPNGGGGGKAFPYSIQQARERLGPALETVVLQANALPGSAKPGGEATSLFTIHPAFLAKTQMPNDVFRRAGLRSVGSRPAQVVPNREVRQNAPLGLQPTAELYISGTPAAFGKLLSMLISSSTGKGVQKEFCKIESVRFLSSNERLLNLAGDDIKVHLEIILHGSSANAALLDSFESHATHCGAQVWRSKLLAVPGLIFMPALAPRSHLEEFASFSALRALRRLPVLRLNRPVIRHRLTTQAPELPKADAIDKTLKVVVFDGGLGVNDFGRWCVEHVPDELKDTHADYLSHGNEVTSALLFGAVTTQTVELPRPYFDVEHYRVIGRADEKDPDLYDCLQRLDKILQEGEIDFANLSLGPRLAIDDGQPHAWTAMLDQHLSSGRTFMTVAVGNDGAIGGPMGRIQPPADAVNALSVGAADSTEFMWSRAEYSCMGPGRAPGIVKPDGLAFGGTQQNPVVILNPLSGGLTGVQGTSFASPLALRTAAAARAISDTPLTATALRALMIHKAEKFSGHDIREVGWGRFVTSGDDLLTCQESEVSALYQGHIEAGGTMRIGLPIPAVALGVGLRITATFCFCSQVDPADPVNYTRHGLTITFRPKGDGSVSPFFSTSSYGSEQDLRRDAYKWETVLHRTCTFRADELLNACFDVDHGAREKGLSTKNSDVPPLPYVLVATIATEKGEPIYQSVMQKYRALSPIRLRTQVQLRNG